MRCINVATVALAGRVRWGSEGLESRWGDRTTNRDFDKLPPLQIFNHPRGLQPKNLGFMRVFSYENFRY